MTRCAACPLAPGRECHGGSGLIPHLCDFAASGDPGRIMLVVDRHGFPAPATAAAVEPAPVPAEVNPAIAEQIDCIKRARACPHRVTDGSCQTARCKLGKGRDGVVYLSDCLDCLKGQP